jgi:hypothetical protein
MSLPRILQLSDEALSLIAEFLTTAFFEEARCLYMQRSRRLEVNGPIAALYSFEDEPILHGSRLTNSSMLQLHWRVHKYSAIEINAQGVPVLDHAGRPVYVEWWYTLTRELAKQTRARIDYEYGGFLLPCSRIMRAQCRLQDAIREELKVVEEELPIIPYLHLHELPSVKSNCELYTTMHEIQ